MIENNDRTIYGAKVVDNEISGTALKFDYADDYANCGNVFNIGTSPNTICT